MREAMMTAAVGDDVFGDDPSVCELQRRAAALLGKEAALFVPSGTMANQICIRAHTEPGDEIIVEAGCHIYLYEGGGYAALSGVSIRPVPAERGLLTADQVRGAIRPPGGLSHFPPSRLVCVENTANRGGGTIYSQEALAEIGAVAGEHGMRYHLDGARLFNAAVGAGVPVHQIAAPFDSVSVCLSKGLGCPVGSLVLGTQTFIDRAHRFRKMLGGGMRQAGILAAAGVHALDHHVDRLADDHRRARGFAEAATSIAGVHVDLEGVQTNMVYADVSGTGRDAHDLAEALSEADVYVVAVSPTHIRAVFHLDVDDAGLDAAIKALGACATSR
jgi:threonine aldolase